MEATTPRSRIGGSRAGQVLASRRGGMFVAVISAAAAGVLIYLFVQHYKKNATTTATSSYVFVAHSFIPRGTPASTVSAKDLLTRSQVSHGQVVAGAIADPSQIQGQVAVTDIAAGSQVTAADFTHANISISSYLSGDNRAIAIPLDAAHGLTAYVAAGDHVDVVATSAGAVVVLGQDISVLGNASGNIVLRVTDKQAAAIADASDNAKVWITLRPPTGAQDGLKPGVQKLITTGAH